MAVGQGAIPRDVGDGLTRAMGIGVVDIVVAVVIANVVIVVAAIVVVVVVAVVGRMRAVVDRVIV